MVAVLTLHGCPLHQVSLLKQVYLANSKTVVCLMHGGMVGVDPLNGGFGALVSLGYPGMYAAESLASTLFGLNDHAWGKLPVTW